MKATKKSLFSMAALSVMACSCEKSQEYVQEITDRSREITLELCSPRQTKAEAGAEGLLHSTDTCAFMVTLDPMDDCDGLTKASAVSSLPSSLNWLCTTGSAGSEAVKWSGTVSVSGGKAHTGRYQTLTPTSYNHYISNAAIALTSGGPCISTGGDSDIIVGSATSSTSNPSMGLTHIFARTGSVNVNPPSGCTIENASVTIKASAGGGTSGTFNIRNGSWSSVGGLTTAAALSSSSDMYLVPGQYTVSASFTLRKGSWSKSLTRTGTVSLKAGCVNNITLNNSDEVSHEVEITRQSGSLMVGATSWFLVKYYTLTNGVRDAGTDVSSHAETSITASNANVKFYYPSVSGSTASQKNGVVGVSPGNVRLTASFRGTSGYIDLTIADKTITSTWYEYSKPWFNIGGIADIPASGGTSAAPGITNVGQQRRTATRWSDGTTTYSGWENTTPAYSTLYSPTNANFSTTHTGLSAGSLGTSVKDRTKLGTMYVIVQANGVNSDTQYRDVYQAANAISSYGAITISQFSYATPAWNSTDYVSPTLAYSQAITYTSGASASTTSGLTKSFSHSNSSEFTMNTGTGGIKVNSIPSTTVYDAPVITNFKLSPDPVAAKGGIVTPSFSYSQALRRDIPTRTDVATVTVSGNGKSTSKTATRTQAGNTGVISTTQAAHSGASFTSSAFTAVLSAVGSTSSFTVTKSSNMVILRWLGHNLTHSKSAQVKMDFTMNGKTTSAYATTTQSAATASGSSGGTSYTVVIDKTQLYVEREIMYGNGNSITNHTNDKFTVKCNGTDVTSSCSKTGYNTSIISVDANGTVHYAGEGETTIKVSYTDAGGTSYSFDVHVRSELVEEYN